MRMLSFAELILNYNGLTRPADPDQNVQALLADRKLDLFDLKLAKARCL
jgi:hypothetical protein